jgi:O-antigen ligase
MLLLVGTSFTLLLYTYSRSALGVALGTFLVWAAWGSMRRRLLVFGALALAFALLFPVLSWRFEDLVSDVDQAPVSGEEVTNSFAWRLLNYQRLLGSFRESPIVGHGLTAIWEINPTRTRTAEGFDSGYAAHNEIVRVLVEQGALGLLVWIIVAFGIWRSIGTLTAFQKTPTLGGHPQTGETLRALFLTLFLLSGVGMAFLNQTVLLYVIFTVLGALRVGMKDLEPGVC